MKILPMLILIPALLGCHVNRDKFKPMADAIKKEYMAQIPNIKSVDTIYLMIKAITPRGKNIIQSAEYRWAWTQAKREHNPDSSFYENKSNEIIDRTDAFDSTTFLCYAARPMAIFTMNNMKKGIAESGMYFDKDMKTYFEIFVY